MGIFKKIKEFFFKKKEVENIKLLFIRNKGEEKDGGLEVGFKFTPYFLKLLRNEAGLKQMKVDKFLIESLKVIIEGKDFWGSDEKREKSQKKLNKRIIKEQKKKMKEQKKKEKREGKI